MITPQKTKYYGMYMDIAIRAAQESVAVKAQVGCAIITKTGLISIGYNGTPAGMNNECEVLVNDKLVTKPEVIHAERNALDKLAREGVPAKDSILFVTLSPCMECAKSIHAVGVSRVYYLNEYRDLSGIQFLRDRGVDCLKWRE